MNELAFERDIRSTEPNETRHRRARFREGWRKAIAGERYNEATLRELTLGRLGYRLGALLGGWRRHRSLMSAINWCACQRIQLRTSSAR